MHHNEFEHTLTLTLTHLFHRVQHASDGRPKGGGNASTYTCRNELPVVCVADYVIQNLCSELKEALLVRCRVQRTRDCHGCTPAHCTQADFLDLICT